MVSERISPDGKSCPLTFCPALHSPLLILIDDDSIGRYRLGKRQPNLSFRGLSISIGDLTNKHSGVLLPAIALANIRGHASRGPANLVSERIFFFLRKTLRLFKYLPRKSERQLVF